MLFTVATDVDLTALDAAEVYELGECVEERALLLFDLTLGIRLWLFGKHLILGRLLRYIDAGHRLTLRRHEHVLLGRSFGFDYRTLRLLHDAAVAFCPFVLEQTRTEWITGLVRSCQPINDRVTTISAPPGEADSLVDLPVKLVPRHSYAPLDANLRSNPRGFFRIANSRSRCLVIAS